MQNKQKIINDPIYGFIRIPDELIFELISHSYFQRLRRISQGGLASLVYPGATHTRFHHSLGAMHLMTMAVSILRQKGVQISDEEAQALSVASLLHDIGHGPYSHALENKLIDMSHEEIGKSIMRELNDEFNGALDLAIQIFEGNYHRPFMSTLIASQLDVDRLDYLSRDSFYTGVVEGQVGYNRLLQMMNVSNEKLVIEEKGVLSLEKFLLSRKHMYLQVYLHHTGLGAETMLVDFINLLKVELQRDRRTITTSLEHFLSEETQRTHKSVQIENFCLLDDSDILYQIKKESLSSDNKALNYIAKRLINRQICKVRIFDKQEECNFYYEKAKTNERISEMLGLDLVRRKSLTLDIYNFDDELFILRKDGGVRAYSDSLKGMFNLKPITKYTVCQY